MNSSNPKEISVYYLKREGGPVSIRTFFSFQVMMIRIFVLVDFLPDDSWIFSFLKTFWNSCLIPWKNYVYNLFNKYVIPIFSIRPQKSITSDEEVEKDDEDQNGVNFRVMKQKGVEVKSNPKAMLIFSYHQNIFLYFFHWLNKYSSTKIKLSKL